MNAVVVNTSEAALHALREVQARADEAYRSHGTQAPPPVHGEALADYRRRLAAPMARYSTDWAAVPLHSVAAGAGLDVVERTIYADAVAAARSPRDVAPGTLREIVSRDAAGRPATEFFGHPDVTWHPYKAPCFRGKIPDPRGGR